MREWAKHAHGSPLYAHLSEVVADSDTLMRVVDRIDNWPPANVFFAAVHYLLMGDPDAELARFYPSLITDPEPITHVDVPFRDFVVAHETEIVALGRTRLTQTNECRRCVALLPAIWETPLSRFHLVDLGASAGLNLLLDRYGYRWDDFEWHPDSDLVLDTESKGRMPAPRDVEVLSRTGLDLNPVDPTDPNERRWLEALVWPEHHERRQRLSAAIELAATTEVEFVEGSALATLLPTLEALPADEPAVVMNSFTLNQFTSEQRDAVDDLVAEARARRPVARVSFEYTSREDDWPKLWVDDGSGWRLIGQGHPHGEWIEIYARP